MGRGGNILYNPQAQAKQALSLPEEVTRKFEPLPQANSQSGWVRLVVSGLEDIRSLQLITGSQLSEQTRKEIIANIEMDLEILIRETWIDCHDKANQEFTNKALLVLQFTDDNKQFIDVKQQYDRAFQFFINYSDIGFNLQAVYEKLSIKPAYLYAHENETDTSHYINNLRRSTAACDKKIVTNVFDFKAPGQVCRKCETKDIRKHVMTATTFSNYVVKEIVKEIKQSTSKSVADLIKISSKKTLARLDLPEEIATINKEDFKTQFQETELVSNHFS